MSMDDIYAKPGHLIRRAQRIAVAIFIEECAKFDITPVQYASPVAMRENPDVDATRLSALLAQLVELSNEASRAPLRLVSAG